MSSNLCLPTPEIQVESKTDAHSLDLHQYVIDQPTCILRRLAKAVQLDLGLFSSHSLVASNPDHRVEIRTQNQQVSCSDESTDNWHCASSRSHTTIAKYAEYQVSSYIEMQQDSENLDDIMGHSSSELKPADEHHTNVASKQLRRKVIKFGTNVDLSDKKKWKVQLEELEKLPAFAQVNCKSNMLSYAGHTILGVNSVQLYMKVPGCRTPGHQENSNFCSVNINVGPGDCEWFCVSEEYWSLINKLLQKNGLNYLRGSWWPNIEDLFNSKIPVYHFIQKPGDLAWIGPGTVHWVQAIGWCNNIAWNVGPFTELQYRLAIDRSSYYKMEHYQSIIPMIHLSWNLAQTDYLSIADAKLSYLLRDFIGCSLDQCKAALQVAKECNKQVIWHGRDDGEPSHYCEQCLVEVFNILFTMTSVTDKKKHFVYCMDCALSISPKLNKVTILQQYNMKKLQQIYDDIVVACDKRVAQV